MAFRLGAQSRARLTGVHPDLIRVVERAIELWPACFSVPEGLRTPQRPRELYALGCTKPGPRVTWTLTRTITSMRRPAMVTPST